MDEEFKRLYSLGTELKARVETEDSEPVTPERMMEIESLITVCRESAKKDIEKSIVVRTEYFWDKCFRKWHDNPDKLEKELKIPGKKIKIPQSGPVEKANIFIDLIKTTRTLKSGRGLFNMTIEDFHMVVKLIEQCVATATTKHEKRLIKDALETYDKQFDKWHRNLEIKMIEKTKPATENKELENISTADKKFLESLRIKADEQIDE